MRLNIFILTGFITAALIAPPATAAEAPQKGRLDARIKHVRYQDNQVYQLKAHFAYSTVIEFDEQERVETISLGDSTSWQITKPGRPNIIFIKPLAEHADTNMTVLTDKRIYSFMLTASKEDYTNENDLIFRLSFIYPNTPENIKALYPETLDEEYDPLSDEQMSWNFSYDYAGSRALKPEKVFDDGEFTYFLFKRQQSLPAIFAVDEDGNERLVNFMMKGSYLIVSSIERQFTLRDGEQATCLFNQSYPREGGIETTLVPVAPLVESDKGDLLVAGVPRPSRKPKTSGHSIISMFFAGIKTPQTTSYNH